MIILTAVYVFAPNVEKITATNVLQYQPVMPVMLIYVLVVGAWQYVKIVVTLVVKIVLKFAAVAKRPRVRTVELYASTVVKKPNAIVVSTNVMIV